MQHAESTSQPDRRGFWSRNRWLWMGLCALVVGLFAGFVIISLLEASYTYHGTVIQSPDRADDFTLVGSSGEPVSLSDFRGKAVMLYFGYTFCPDVCPATLVELARAQQLLGDDGDDLQVLMITIDPARDTTDKLEAYVTHFDPRFLGLTGEDDAIASAATPYGIYYEKQPGTEASGYLMDHTASVVVIDPDGYLRLIYPFGTSAEDIAEDIAHLIR